MQTRGSDRWLAEVPACGRQTGTSTNRTAPAWYVRSCWRRRVGRKERQKTRRLTKLRKMLGGGGAFLSEVDVSLLEGPQTLPVRPYNSSDMKNEVITMVWKSWLQTKSVQLWFTCWKSIIWPNNLVVFKVRGLIMTNLNREGSTSKLELGNHISTCSNTEYTQDGRSHDLPDACWPLTDSAATKDITRVVLL